jgi:hypothetical protein
MKDLQSITLMQKISEPLLKKGLDFEVTWQQSEKGLVSNVRLFDPLTDETIGSSKKEMVEDAFIEILVNNVLGNLKY